MGKKNKKTYVDYFDMTPEEQKANAERFNSYERGEISFLDVLNYKVPNAPVRQSDYKKQIERACLGIISDNNDDNYVDEISNVLNDHKSDNHTECNYDETSEFIPYSSIAKTIEESNDTHNKNCENRPQTIITYDDEICDEKVEIPNTTESKSESVKAKTIVDNIPRICFAYNSIVGKMLIDDGYVTTPVSVCHTSSINLNEDNIPTDSDGFGALLSKIYYFIISCKHPAVIMSQETFEIEFSVFSKLNFNKFIFFKNNGFVYAYVLDAGEMDNFYSVIDIFNMEDNDILRYVIGAAYASNTMHNIFMYNDEDEVESVMEARHSVKELVKLIDDDPDTEYAGHNSSGDVISRMKVTDLQTFVSDVYSILEDLIESEDDDDDENPYDIDDESDSDDDSEEDTELEDDDDDDDISINDFPDDTISTDISDINSMIDSIESTSNTDIKIPYDDEVVIPKIHRRS
jgi:hypothetical protein